MCPFWVKLLILGKFIKLRRTATHVREGRERNAQLWGARLREDERGTSSYGAHGYVKTREERPATGRTAT